MTRVLLEDVPAEETVVLHLQGVESHPVSPLQSCLGRPLFLWHGGRELLRVMGLCLVMP